MGFGGTNAHVVLEEAPRSNPGMHNGDGGVKNPQSRIRNTKSAHSPSAHLLPVYCYHCRRAARKPFNRWRAHIRTSWRPRESGASLGDICYTASVRRSHHDYRLAVTGNSSEQLTAGLEAFLRGETRPGLSSGRSVSSHRRKLVFVFPGQGSQWWGMGRELLEREAVFREVVERCDRAMRRYCDWSLLAELRVSRRSSVAVERNRSPPAGAVCDSDGSGGAVAFMGYRAAGRGRPQHGRGRGGLRRRRAEPRRCGTGHLQAEPSDQAHHWAGSDGRGGAFHRRRSARSGGLRRSRVHRCQQQSHLDRLVRRSGSARKRSWIDCSVRTSSAGWSKSISPPTALRWIPCALICCGLWKDWSHGPRRCPSIRP